MTLQAIESAAQSVHLTVFGAFHTNDDDDLPLGTLLLLGPHEPGFWPFVTASPEFQDGAPDPMDRWSTRVVSRLAQTLDGEARFPFGQPAQPFITWALRSKSAFVSPASLLVHAQAGLFVSYRGALIVPDRRDLPPPPANPCNSCEDKPCLTACPAHALTDKGYDLPACHGFLDTAPGQSCLSQGCAVRRACPLGAKYPRLHAQSAFHMKAFHR